MKPEFLPLILSNSLRTFFVLFVIASTSIGTFFFSTSQLSAQLPNQNSQSKTPEKIQLGEPPEPIEVILETVDGVKLVCTYYAAPEPKVDKPENADAGKSVIPFVLLHDWDGNRRQFHQFGAFLQSQGHAVIVPDFRGHGASTHVVGQDKEIDFERFRKQETMSATKDIERCKKYLVKRNNEGKLNIDLLCVVAVGKSSPLATQWILTDWFAYPSVNTDGIKQGQDVKALVLISPRKKLGMMSIANDFKNPLFSGAARKSLLMMIVWCPDDKESSRDTKSINSGLEKTRPDLSEIKDKIEREKLRALFLVPIKVDTASGIQLMNTDRVDGLWDHIESTMVKKIRSTSDQHPWQSREKPEDDED